MSARWLETTDPQIDAATLVTQCIESGDSQVLVTAEQLGDAFFDLSSRIAGEVIQQLQNYSLRMAIIDHTPQERSLYFRQFAAELQRSNSSSMRFFTRRADAEAWLRSA